MPWKSISWRGGSRQAGHTINDLQESISRWGATMTTTIARHVLAASIAVFAGFAFGEVAQGREATLRFNRWGRLQHHIWARMMTGWVEQVEKATQGRVKVEFTPASLGPPQRQFELAMTGVADVTIGNQTSTA